MAPMSAAARPRIALIAAVARNGVIGNDNALLWHLPEDLAYFRKATHGHAVIMGRKTWDSLPPRFRPLPGRRNLVVTRQPGWQAAGAEALASLPAVLAALQHEERVFVIGGAELYAAALPLADELLLTEIDRDYAGDAFFPPFDHADFAEQQRESRQAAAPNDFGFAWVQYLRRRAAPA